MRSFVCCLVFVAGLSGRLLPQSGASSTPPLSTQAAAPASTSPTQEPGASNTVLKVKTRLVIVDVIAQDKKGQPVTGLQQSDFKIREDGKPQSISVFAFQHPVPEVAASRPQPEIPAPNVFRNVPRFQTNSALNVILLDALNCTLLDQFYVRDEMVKFLEKLPQGQPVAIYALGRKLRLLQDFTTDLTELKRIVRLFKGESSHVLNNPTGTAEVPMTLQGFADQLTKELDPEIRIQIQNFAQEDTSNRSDLTVAYTVSALTSLARMLAGYPGRKNLIWITESIPMHMFAGSYQPKIEQQGSNLVRVLPDGQSEVRTRRSYDSQLALVANLFADAQVAVYPIDARGLIGSPFYNVANNVSGQGAMGGLAMETEGRQAESLFEAHSTMQELAQETGGKAFYNRNNIDSALLGDMKDGSTYYTVGYYPENKDWNGKFRKIQVSVERHDVKLRYRLGYYAIDRAEYGKEHPQQRDLDFSQALDPNAPVATALQFEASVVPPSANENKVLLRFGIDPHLIYFETNADGLRHGEVDCAARVFSPKNIDHPVKTEAARIQAQLKPEVYEKISRTWFPCELKLDLPAGTYYLRLAVRDNLTGLLGSLNAQVVVPALAVAKTSSPE
jgi:VWFA-related protein